MKKMLFAYVALAFAVTAGAMEKLDPKTCTEADVRAALADTLSVDTSLFWQRGVSNGLWSACEQLRFAALRAEADAALDARGWVTVWWASVASWPKLSARARAETGADVAYAKSIEIATRVGSDISISAVLLHGGTLDDAADVLSEAVAFPRDCYMSVTSWDSARKWMQKAAVQAVKAHIRSQGKSFVTKNGVNPVADSIAGLTAALNAPRFAGLDAWLRNIGCKGVDLSRMPSEEDVAKLREDVLFGRKDMGVRNKAILYVCLGVEGYNAFVKEYNGD